VKGQEKHPLYRALIEAQPKAAFRSDSTLLGRLAGRGAPLAPGERDR
jgi:glutathione peroxidase